MVHRHITVATQCGTRSGDGRVQHPVTEQCVSPPLINPANGANVMDCSSWYTNTSAEMVSCANVQKAYLCCLDGVCPDSVATFEKCRASGLFCSQSWTDKHNGPICDFIQRSQVPSTVDASLASKLEVSTTSSGMLGESVCY